MLDTLTDIDDAPADAVPPVAPVWTVARETRLRALFEEKMSASKIAADLGGVTRSAVIGKLHRLGLKRLEGVVRNIRPSRPRERVMIHPKPVAHPCPRKPVPATLVLPFELTEGAVDIWSLDDAMTMCRWPVGEPVMGHEQLFCGAQTATGLPYCPCHAQIAYTAPARREGGLRLAFLGAR